MADFPWGEPRVSYNKAAAAQDFRFGEISAGARARRLPTHCFERIGDMKVYDIVIVGAGPAGSALAVHLAAAGYRVGLLERGRFPRDKVCGDLVSARGLGLLEELGCLAPVLAAPRVPIRDARVYRNGRPFSTGRMPQVPGMLPHGHAIPRKLLDEILFRRAQQVGAETVEDCRVAGFEYQRDGVLVAADIAGRPVRFKGRIIAGADGAQSVVAKTAGLEMRDPRYVLPAVRAYCHGLSLDHAVLCFEEEFFPGYGWIFPIADGVANIGVGMVQETMNRHGLVLKEFHRRLEAFVRRLAAEHGASVTIDKSAGWVIKAYGAVRRNHFDRGLLIGEAGCFVDPLTGEGIPLALATARLAQDAIQHAFGRGEFGAAALAGYEQRWRREHDADLRVSDLVVSVARNRNLLPLWMQAMNVMAMTAAEDEDYALTLGGIMAGLVPAREGLSPRIILKSLRHGPGFWRSAWDIVGQQSDTGGAYAAQLPAALMRTAADPAWSVRWASELLAKECRLVAALWPGFSSPPAIPKRIAAVRTGCAGAEGAGAETSAPAASRRALVLGASGHIGNAVVRELLQRGWEITAVSRRAEPPFNLTGLPVRFLQADGDEPGTFDRIVAGHRLVVDAAAPYPIHLLSIGQGGRSGVVRHAERRTDLLLRAVRRHRASLAYIGSFVTAPRKRDPLAGLSSRALLRLHPYFTVKQCIERRITAGMRTGLPSAIFNPTVCIGPWDLKPRRHCLIPQLLCSEVPGVVRHEVNVIDVRDVAKAVGAAADAGRYGEVIPLGGHNLSIDALVRQICRVGGRVAPPRLLLPPSMALCGTVSTETLLNLAGRASPSPALATILATESCWTAPSPAQLALGAHPRPLSVTLTDAIDWYRSVGYC